MKKPSKRQAEALRALLPPGARVKQDSGFGGGYVRVADKMTGEHIRADTLGAIKMAGWVRWDETVLKPERWSFGRNKPEKIAPIDHVLYTITPEGRRAIGEPSYQRPI